MSQIEPSSHAQDANQSPLNCSEKQPEKFFVKFWGVRGLIPTPGEETNFYGGNTACVEMQVGTNNLIFDGGTGLRVLGKSWLKQQQELVAHLFFTNAQTNRIQGFPFFAPAFAPQNYLHIYGTAASNGASIKQSLGDQMLLPHFPYPLQAMKSELQFYYLTPDKAVSIDDVIVEMALINNVTKSIGYKVIWKDYSVAYITDLQSKIDDSEQESLKKLTQEADLMIVNPGYITSDFRNSQTPIDCYWQVGVDLARKAGVKKLVFSNHHPNDNDDFLNRVQTNLKSEFEQAFLAREGMVISVN
ncbi:metal-dependent hydrolase, beta-lactamase superfamily I [Rivularia sp. PCC 7116]|uniref:MBL fold metallo-hydrolase n=1 Tax=Rivularia sp. PCC 7116 TaxID=373994 RepID=UPI00029F0D90|nr:MBL fold metallo-hydrolase [Rivularia sp. PCC 7116]AFY53682.1 metal-dependent hydrolase, beta-lactamase superfamily I [Rivularia sp. PCC 7116]